MSSNNTTVSVVICAYLVERWNELLDAVQSIRAQSYPVSEIIVVVDHNSDLLELAQRRWNMDPIRVVANTDVQGASGCRNSGVAIAISEMVAFIDDDAVADREWLAVLMRASQQPDVMGAGGTIEPMWRELSPQWLPGEFYWVVGCSYTGLPEVAAPVRNLIAAGMCVWRDVYISLGGFRVGFGNVKAGDGLHQTFLRGMAGDEETEFCIRGNLRWPHRFWLHVPDARVFHAVPGSRTTWSYFIRRCVSEGYGKALMTSYCGMEAGLSSERHHLVNIIPRGLSREVRDLLSGDFYALVRCSALIVGIAATGFGFLGGIVTSFPEIVRNRGISLNARH